MQSIDGVRVPVVEIADLVVLKVLLFYLCAENIVIVLNWLEELKRRVAGQ